MKTNDQLAAREINLRLRAVNRTALAGVLDLHGQSIVKALCRSAHLSRLPSELWSAWEDRNLEW